MNLEKNKKISYLFVLTLFVLLMQGCFQVSEIGENSFYFKKDGVEIVPKKKLNNGTSLIPVDFNVYSDKLEIFVNNFNSEINQNFSMKIFINNFNGPGIYHFTYNIDENNGIDNFIILNELNKNYYSTNNQDDGYVEILEYSEQGGYIRGLFTFDVFDDSGDKISITDGRFDWEIF